MTSTHAIAVISSFTVFTRAELISDSRMQQTTEKIVKHSGFFYFVWFYVNSAYSSLSLLSVKTATISFPTLSLLSLMEFVLGVHSQ